MSDWGDVWGRAFDVFCRAVGLGDPGWLTDEHADRLRASEPDVFRIFGSVDRFHVQPHRRKVVFGVHGTVRLDLLEELRRVLDAKPENVELLPEESFGEPREDGDERPQGTTLVQVHF